MSGKKYTCVVCPEGCAITVTKDARGGILSVSGNKCRRGEAYVRQEAVNPQRNLSSTVVLIGGQKPVIPVKTSGPIAKDKIMDVMGEIRHASVKSPVKAGQVIIKNVARTGRDIIAASDAR
jgi:CxxC motif-containing protein